MRSRAQARIAALVLAAPELTAVILGVGAVLPKEVVELLVLPPRDVDFRRRKSAGSDPSEGQGTTEVSTAENGELAHADFASSSALRSCRTFWAT